LTGSRLALTGPDGAGKTQIALEYAHRFAADYDVVWFAAATQPAMLRADLAELAAALGMPDAATIAGALSARSVALGDGCAPLRCLLILDNVGEPEELRELLPAGVRHVLITARSRAWHQECPAIELAAFGCDEHVVLGE
jgi:hypothetical protein